MPHCSRERSLQRKALQCAGNSTAWQTCRQPPGHGLEATLLPFQRPCERAGITKWPFHEITGSADNSVFSQVWFVHKNISWNLKGLPELQYVTKWHWTGSDCSLVGISSMHNPVLILAKLFLGGGHKYDSYVLFILTKRSTIVPNDIVQKAYLLSFAETSNISAYSIAKWPGMCFWWLVLRLVALSSLACFISVRTEFSSRGAGELLTKGSVEKAQRWGTNMVCVTTVL